MPHLLLQLIQTNFDDTYHSNHRIPLRRTDSQSGYASRNHHTFVSKSPSLSFLVRSPCSFASSGSISISILSNSGLSVCFNRGHNTCLVLSYLRQLNRISGESLAASSATHPH